MDRARVQRRLGWTHTCESPFMNDNGSHECGWNFQREFMVREVHVHIRVCILLYTHAEEAREHKHLEEHTEIR